MSELLTPPNDVHAAAAHASRPAESAWEAALGAALVTDATGLAVLAVEGEDAGDFLQGQLSNDVRALAPGQGQWTSCNSPKGRMLATLFLYRPAGAGTSGTSATPRYRMLVADDLAEPIRKRLSMFILRAKVRIADERGQAQLLGIAGPQASAAVDAALGAVPSPKHVASHSGTDIVALPDGRFVAVAPIEAAGALLDALERHATIAPAAVWSWLGVRSGIPMLGAATQDLFVAQTANWDAVGGLDFRKGCYTGQEIIARTQYLGRLKERTYLFVSEAPAPAPATRLYSAAFGEQASGTVVNSAAGPDGRAWFLAVVQIVAAEGGTVTIGAPDGPVATLEALPYALPAPVAPPGRMAR